MRAGRRLALAVIAALPFLAKAQGRVARKRVAFVGFRGMHEGPDGLDRIVEALARQGYVEGRQIEVLRIIPPERPADHPLSGLDYVVPTLRDHVLPANPEVIVVVGSIMTKAMHAVTRTIPIVASVSDPVDLGVAASLARPGGNVTGVTRGLAETSLKAMEALKAIVPRLVRVAIFHYARPVAAQIAGHYERAATSVGVEPVRIAISEDGDDVRQLHRLDRKRIQAAVHTGPGTLDDARPFFQEAAARRLPLLGLNESEVESGCLLAYEVVDGNLTGRLAAVVEEVIRGADPATTPFQFPRNFRLAINQRTAKALGITVPPALRVRADRVFE
jgi:putative ABC transport system substrate-binding protein